MIINMKFFSNAIIDQKPLLQFSLLYLSILIIWYVALLNNSNVQDVFNLYPNSFYFEPFISIYIFELIKSSQILYILAAINIIVIPYFILVLMFKVYSKFIEPKYAFLFSLLSLSISSEKNFRDFLYSISQSNYMDGLSYADFPLIFKFPFPSLSTLFFLFLFYSIINIKKWEYQNYWIITILSTLFFYINALAAVFILLLWFFVLCFDGYKAKHGMKYLLFHITLTVALLLPGVLENSVVENRETTITYDYYNLVLYNFLPLFLSFVFFKIKRIDPYEVWFKFKYIYLFLGIEIFINLLVYSKIFIIDLNILNKQVLQFVIHLLYYTPIIYYLSRQSINYRFGPESNRASIKISNFFFYTFTNLKKPFFYLLIILLLAFNFPLIIFV